jgi:hypothetical protein
MNERDALLAIYKIGVKNEIEEVKAAGEPAAVDVLPSDADADALLWMRWDAATRDSILLYDGSGSTRSTWTILDCRMLGRQRPSTNMLHKLASVLETNTCLQRT